MISNTPMSAQWYLLQSFCIDVFRNDIINGSKLKSLILLYKKWATTKPQKEEWKNEYFGIFVFKINVMN